MITNSIHNVFNKTSFLTLLLFSVLFNFAQLNPNGWDTAWVNSFGGTDSEYGRDLKETSDKGFIIVGTTNTFGNGNTSFYIIKTDSLGKHNWSKSIGTNNNEVAYSVDICSDKGYFFSGVSNSNLGKGYDGYVIKTDSSGNELWSKYYGGTDWDFFYNSCLMPDGGLILCGETYSESQGGSDFFLVRIDINGDTLWSKKFGDTGNDVFYSVEQKFNTIYVVGSSSDSTNNYYKSSIYKLDLNGKVLSSKSFSTSPLESSKYNDVFITDSGSILTCGTLYNSNYKHFFMQKLDTSNFSILNYITTNSVTNQDLVLNCVIEGYNNNIYAFGTETGGLGGKAAAFLRFDTQFSYISSADFGGLKDEAGYEIIKTSKGYALVGSTNSYGNLNNSDLDNVYLVVFNKKDLVNDYFLMLNEYQDTLSPVGINQNSIIKNSINISPNPVSSSYTINFSSNFHNGKEVIFLIYDGSGSLVSEERHIVIAKQITSNRNNLSSGLYSFKILTDSKQIYLGKIYFE